MGAKSTSTPSLLIRCPPYPPHTHSNNSFYDTPELPELAKVKDPDEPESPGTERSPITASEYAVLEKRNVQSPAKQRVYVPIVANVVCWSACLDNQLAWSRPGDNPDEPGVITYDRGVLTAGFTTGLRGAAANYNAMPGGFNTEQRDATYAELFDWIVAQERQAYEERIDYSVEMARLYQDPQVRYFLQPLLPHSFCFRFSDFEFPPNSYGYPSRWGTLWTGRSKFEQR
ncbi:hypothetical protein FRC08_017700 [Ceratobasidium sp. 394]|nr:hypothetical protein FRC08_017700 [Ceratobasidium sp. 394]